MTVVVSFLRASPGNGPGSGVTGIGRVRVRENISVPGTTTATAQQDEIVIIGNGESSMIAVACGTTPDAAALAENYPVTGAGVCVGAGSVSYPILPSTGDKINVKAVS